MCYQIVLVLCSFQIGKVILAPLQMFLQPQLVTPQQILLQQQIQALQRLQSVPTPYNFNWPSQPMPMMIFPLPNVLSAADNTKHKLIMKAQESPTMNHDLEKFLNKHKPHSTKDYDDDDDDSVVINAEANIHHRQNNDKSEAIEAHNQRALILLPNGRYVIGSIISTIPFLPFEVNVPDTISWAWNGISSIISGIGQRLPFRPNPQETASPQQEDIMKLLLKRLPATQTMMEPAHPNFGPVIVIPIGDSAMELRY